MCTLFAPPCMLKLTLLFSTPLFSTLFFSTLLFSSLLLSSLLFSTLLYYSLLYSTLLFSTPFSHLFANSFLSVFVWLQFLPSCSLFTVLFLFLFSFFLTHASARSQMYIHIYKIFCEQLYIYSRYTVYTKHENPRGLCTNPVILQKSCCSLL